MMNYNRRLHEATAYLLMLRQQNKDYDYNVIVSQYIYDSGGEWQDNTIRAVDSVAILLSLEMCSALMPADIIDKLEHNIAELAPEDFSEYDCCFIEEDLRTARLVIDWYRTTPDKMT